MGNHTSCVTVGINQETIQLVCSDGTHQNFRKPLSAAQIIEEFPQHLVCHSESFYIGQKTAALSPNDQLKVGSKYFLLPQHFFHSPLSLLLLASLISPPPPSKTPLPSNSSVCVSAPVRRIESASLLCHPFDIQKSDAGGGLRIRVCPEFVTKLIENSRLNVDEGGPRPKGRDYVDGKRGLCHTPELQKDYEELVKSRGHCWKPTLESIREKENNVGHKIFARIKRY